MAEQTDLIENGFEIAYIPHIGILDQEEGIEDVGMLVTIINSPNEDEAILEFHLEELGTIVSCNEL